MVTGTESSHGNWNISHHMVTGTWVTTW